MMTPRQSTHREPNAHPEKRYWFPAKRYGWGWSFPSTWQGWLVIALYLILILGAIPVLHPGHDSLPFGLYASVLTFALIAVCWWKGEPPHWHWGDR